MGFANDACKSPVTACHSDELQSTEAASVPEGRIQSSEVVVADVNSRPTVLCIDDDPDISYSIELRLRAFDINWVWACFGTQGIWNCINDRPDIVLLDYKLPQGRGDEVLQTLKHHDRTWDIPVVILTGHPGVERQMSNLGANAFLAKPLNIDVLLATLSRFIDLRRRDS